MQDFSPGTDEPGGEPSDAAPPLAGSTGGDPDVLVVACFGRLRRLASRMLSQYTSSRRQEDTDDLLQNAALRMRRALAEVVVESPAHAMALAVTQIKRELVDLIRRLRRRPDSSAELLAGDPAVRPERLDAWSNFHEAVARLPTAEREAVHFLWYLGLDQEEAAKLLGVSSRTLRRHWRMARAQLRRELGDIDFGY